MSTLDGKSTGEETRGWGRSVQEMTTKKRPPKKAETNFLVRASGENLGTKNRLEFLSAKPAILYSRLPAQWPSSPQHLWVLPFYDQGDLLESRATRN